MLVKHGWRGNNYISPSIYHIPQSSDNTLEKMKSKSGLVAHRLGLLPSLYTLNIHSFDHIKMITSNSLVERQSSLRPDSSGKGLGRVYKGFQRLWEP